MIKKSESSQGKGVFVYDIKDCLDKSIKWVDITWNPGRMEQPIYDIRMMMVGTELSRAMKTCLAQ